jgi:hypothetical protein
MPPLAFFCGRLLSFFVEGAVPPGSSRTVESWARTAPRAIRDSPQVRHRFSRTARPLESNPACLNFFVCLRASVLHQIGVFV